MRTCTRCDTRVADDASCPNCLRFFRNRPDAQRMTNVQRLAEFDSWFRSRLPEIGNNLVAQRISELTGHPVHPMGIATPTGRKALRREIATR